MKDFDRYIIDRWFWKFVEHGDINDFENDVFKNWVEENDIPSESLGKLCKSERRAA